MVFYLSVTSYRPVTNLTIYLYKRCKMMGWVICVLPIPALFVTGVKFDDGESIIASC